MARKTKRRWPRAGRRRAAEITHQRAFQTATRKAIASVMQDGEPGARSATMPTVKERPPHLLLPVARVRMGSLRDGAWGSQVAQPGHIWSITAGA